VYEYLDGNDESRVIKFFRPHCFSEFLREVKIYKILGNSPDISLKMLWYNTSRVAICTNGAKKIIEMSEISPQGIKSIYDSLRQFHFKTGHVHRDIYYKNILQITKDKLILNDFCLAAPIGTLSEIKGNIYSASDRVLESKNNIFKYEISDDIYSLTFSLIFLLHFEYFSQEFQKYSMEGGKKLIVLIRKNTLKSINKGYIALQALEVSKKGDYDEAKNLIIAFSGK
jgi:serine/threonine protein kinase